MDKKLKLLSKKLLEIFKFTSHEDEIKFLHGIRSIASFVLIYFHFFLIRNLEKINNSNFSRSEIFHLMLSNAVNIFFVISGALLSRKVLKDLQRCEILLKIIFTSTFSLFFHTRNNLNIKMILLKRYLSIAPSVAVTVAPIFMFFLFKNFFRNFLPDEIFIAVEKVSKNCREGWLSTIFFTQNFTHKFREMVRIFYLKPNL